MKIGVFGGSFNPIHNGHIALLQVFVGALSLDKALVIPAFVSPFKQGADGTLPEHRLAMCRLAFENDPHTEVSSIELQRGGASYTYLTLQELKRQYPDSELYLITGADSFMTIQRWKKPEEIFRNAVICTIPRDDDDFKTLTYHAAYLHTWGARTKVLDARVMSVSSTEVREHIRKGEDISTMVPLSVENYIRAHGLYQS